jgi:hypothetical protein
MNCLAAGYLMRFWWFLCRFSQPYNDSWRADAAGENAGGWLLRLIMPEMGIIVRNWAEE